MQVFAITPMSSSIRQTQWKVDLSNILNIKTEISLMKISISYIWSEFLVINIF